MKQNKIVAVLPARYGSTRFPGKPLATIAGKPMIQHVYEAASKAKSIQQVIVATDDLRIQKTVQKFGGNAIMTSPNHTTGTDRIAEAVQNIDANIILNIQGDEPLIPTQILEKLIDGMLKSQADMATVASPFSITDRDVNDPNAVKVVIDKNNLALYFSRSPIPYCRQGGKPSQPLLHWGLYAYQKSFLQKFVNWKPSQLEQCEMLEQLRALENGAKIWVTIANQINIGVDTPQDIPKVEKILAERKINNEK